MAAQNLDPCKEGYCKEKVFHVTDVETKDILDTPDGEACRVGMCTGTHYEVSGYVQEQGKNPILYRASCNDITWLAGPNKGKRTECTTVEAGVSYRSRIFPTTIDFSMGKVIWHYTITAQHEATGK